VDKRIFDNALLMVMREAFGNDWEDDASAIEIDMMGIWGLYLQLKDMLILHRQNEEPVNFPLVHDMTAAEFVQNMYQTHGFES